jgi:hypothetical protein
LTRRRSLTTSEEARRRELARFPPFSLGEAMRVEIRHRNEGSWKRKHFIDLTVIFSEEERRVITIRGLKTIGLDLTPGILASSAFPVPRLAITLISLCSPLLFLGGCVSVALGGEGGVLFMIAAVCLFAYVIYAHIKLAGANITTINISDFFEEPVRPVLVPPLYAAITTTEIKRRVGILAQLIEQSANLTVEIFEL